MARRVATAARYLSRAAVSRSRASVAITSPFFTRSPISALISDMAPLMRAATSPARSETSRPMIGTVWESGSVTTASTRTDFGGGPPERAAGPLRSEEAALREAAAGCGQPAPEKKPRISPPSRDPDLSQSISSKLAFSGPRGLVAVDDAVAVRVGGLRASGQRRRGGRGLRTAGAGEEAADLAAVEGFGPVAVHLVEVGLQRAAGPRRGQ